MCLKLQRKKLTTKSVNFSPIFIKKHFSSGSAILVVVDLHIDTNFLLHFNIQAISLNFIDFITSLKLRRKKLTTKSAHFLFIFTKKTFFSDFGLGRFAHSHDLFSLTQNAGKFFERFCFYYVSSPTKRQNNNKICIFFVYFYQKKFPWHYCHIDMRLDPNFSLQLKIWANSLSLF